MICSAGSEAIHTKKKCYKPKHCVFIVVCTVLRGQGQESSRAIAAAAAVGQSAQHYTTSDKRRLLGTKVGSEDYVSAALRKEEIEGKLQIANYG